MSNTLQHHLQPLPKATVNHCNDPAVTWTSSSSCLTYYSLPSAPASTEAGDVAGVFLFVHVCAAVLQVNIVFFMFQDCVRIYLVKVGTEGKTAREEVRKRGRRSRSLSSVVGIQYAVAAIQDQLEAKACLEVALAPTTTGPPFPQPLLPPNKTNFNKERAPGC
jgi:hypothetical protein